MQEEVENRTLKMCIRDSVYIPLGGNRVTTAKHIRNLLIVWGLTGVWHGAGINFLLWGLYYGVLLIIEKYLIGGFLKKHKAVSYTHLRRIRLPDFMQEDR